MASRQLADSSAHRRILIACQPTTGGAARHVLDLSQAFARFGWHVTVAAPQEGWLLPRLRPTAVSTISLPMCREIRPWRDLGSFVRLWRICRRQRPSILHLHASKAGFLGRLAGRLAGVPAIVYTPHCWSFQLATGHRQSFYTFLERFASRFCDMTVAVSQKEADEAVERGVLGRHKLSVIHNGIAGVEDGDLDETLGQFMDGASSVITSVGRLDEQKGYSYLLDAFVEILKEEPGARLVIAGGGPLLESLRAQCEKLGIEKSVLFAGELDTVGPLLLHSTLFVLPSLWGEGMPYTILEAMWAGLPVIVTRVGGCPEVVSDGVTGKIVAPADSRQLARAVLDLLGDEKGMRKIGRQGRNLVNRDFTLDTSVRENEAMCARLLDLDNTPDGTRGLSPLQVLAITSAVTLVALAGVDELVNANRIFTGIRSGGVSVGGLTRSEAAASLSRNLSGSRLMSILTDEGTTTVKIRAPDFGVDPVAAANQAYLVGRSGNIFARLGIRLEGLTRGIALDVTTNPRGSVAFALKEAERLSYRAPIEAGFVLTDGKIRTTPARRGTRLDRRRAIGDLTEAFVTGRESVRSRTVDLRPATTNVEAAVALREVAAWVGRPASVRLGQIVVPLSPATIARIVRVRQGRAAIDPAQLTLAVGKAAAEIQRKPVDARFEVVGGRVRIEGGFSGTRFDARASAERLAKALGSSRTCTLVLRSVAPQVTRSDLASLRITKMLSSYTTEFLPGRDGRDVNINLAASRVRGRIVSTGDIFSLNSATGPRNRLTGYRESLVFSGGRVVPGIGGGTCQVSSTLYNAALLAGLRIVERSPHSMSVSYVQPGRDATTFYPSVDLKFQNNQRDAILLWSTVHGNRLTMQVYGSGPRPRVAIETVVRRLMPARTRIVYDASLRTGARVVESSGKPGYIVSSFRSIWEGKRLVRRFLATDRYKPRATIIRVGV